MLVKLENPQLFSKSIDLISELVLEVRLKFNEFGMSITAIDPANVAMISFRIPKSAFSTYELDNEVLGVNLDSLKKILKRTGSKSSLIMKRNENMLEINIEDRIRRSFTLNLIEIETEEKELPEWEFSSVVEITSSDFIDSIEDCAVISDACSFIIEDGKFILEAKELNSARSEFSSDEAKIEAENCKSRYSLEYLQKFAKGSKLFEKTILNFANDHPLRIDLKSESLSLSFILAPRMETED
ncbi:MAG: proliferating cell nuclear antigen (pcna) [Nanoarchaeota archaeon]|nr:proliferating cell nuclear antigen (pcna) [Nanoarchaeota archaeon]